MYDSSASGMAYNRFTNLDGIEDRVIRYLLYCDDLPDEDTLHHEDRLRLVNRIRRILLYNNNYALYPLVHQDKDTGEWELILEGYPNPEDIAESDINVTDSHSNTYYRGLAYVPKDSGIAEFNFPTGVTPLVKPMDDDLEYVWVLAKDAIKALIFDDCNYDDQANKRVFRSPRLSDAFDVQCSLLKVYVDSIIPTDHIKSVVNIGIDVVVNTKIINVGVYEDTPYTYIYETHNKFGDKYIVPVSTKSRVTTLTQAVLSLLNGAAVQGVGKMIFSRNLSIYNQGQYGLWNNRDFEGMKLVIGVYMSGAD